MFYNDFFKGFACFWQFIGKKSKPARTSKAEDPDLSGWPGKTSKCRSSCAGGEYPKHFFGEGPTKIYLYIHI